MRFPPSFLDELRERLPVSEVVGRRVKLRKAGREWKGLSPFNQEKTPSFFVNDQKMAWFDFSSGKNGNIFDFVMATEGLSFPEAVERLAVQAGMPLPKVSREDEAREQRERTLYEALELAAKYFETTLASTRGAKARGYLADRGIKADTQLEFRVGYAPSERFALKEHLGKQGIPISLMIEAGLLVAGDDIPVPYDRFRDRIIIPIHDQRGRVIAFGGRTLNDDVQPKYLNSPETPIFHKGSNVFNFHRARQPAHDNGSVVVVEGYMDAIAIYQAGLKSVVATMGTAFTEEQVATLWRLANEPVVCFDADRAGMAAAHRSIDRILPLLKVGRSFRFAFLPGETDPDELIREKGIAAFKAVLQGSLPLWDFFWSREVNSGSFDTPDARAAFEQKLYSIIRTINDPLVSAQYRGTCRVELSDLFWKTTKARLDQKKGPPKLPITITKEGHHHGLQKILLGLLVHCPVLLEEKEENVGKVEFAGSLKKFHHALFDLLVDSADVSVNLIYEKLDPSFYRVLEDVHGHQKEAEVLNDVHGHQSEGKPRGHSLFARFPIMKLEPSLEFVAACIDHFVNVLVVEQMAEELEQLILGDEPLATDAAGERLTELVRHIQELREINGNMDATLAEQATDFRNALLGPADFRRIAA
jgi:DNA primase